jgi:hypothetical protein
MGWRERAKGFLGLSGKEKADDLMFNPMFLPRAERFRDEGVLADQGRKVNLNDEVGLLLFKGRADRGGNHVSITAMSRMISYVLWVSCRIWQTWSQQSNPRL